MNWYKTSKEVSHDYSWVYINLPSQIGDKLIEFGKEIAPDDLYTKEAAGGLEKDPHCTVKYALLTNDFKDIKEVMDGEKRGKFYLGESSIFEQDKYDVVKIDVESDDLKRLHERLNNLPHEDKYPDYHAHATIAYVKSGTGKKYVGKFKINKSFKFKEVFFGDLDRKDHKIKLAFNLSRYRYAQIWNVTMENDGIEDKIAALYELEYKYSMVRDRFQGMPERQTNILNYLKIRLDKVLEEIKAILIKVFGDWLANHAILSADLWAKRRRIETHQYSAEDSFDIMVREYVRYALNKGDGSVPIDFSDCDKYFNDMLMKAQKNISQFPFLYKFLKNHKKQLNDKLGIDEFVQSIENVGYTPEVLEEFYKNFVFPHWISHWKSMGIEDTRANIERIYAKLQQINTNDIGNALAIISLAINTEHQGGDMLEYMLNYSNGSSGSAREMSDFLNEMSSGKRVEEWNKELRDVGVKI